MILCDHCDNPIFQIGTVVALGFFDGVHRGHAAVISHAVTAAECGLLPVVFTFCESPHHAQAPLLMSERQKEQAIAALGAGALIRVPFDQLRELSPSDFVDQVLIGQLCARKVVCGFNYRFGKNAAGDCQQLRRLLEKHGVELEVIPPVSLGGQPISSTRIRKALKEGYVDTAAELLGRPFCFDFTVVDGDRRGRLLGAPTINQPFPQQFIRPRFGVYVASALVEQKQWPAVCNIGVRPTVGADCVRAETFLLDYHGDLYGQQVPVSLYKFLRPEIKFASLEELTRAIHNDAGVAGRYMQRYFQQHKEKR